MQPQIQADCQRELAQKRNNPGRIGLAAHACRSVELTNASATLSKFGGVSEQNGWRREAPVVLQSSLVTRRPATHPPRAPAPTCPVPSAGEAKRTRGLGTARLWLVLSGGWARTHLRRRGASLRLAAHHVGGHPAICQPAPARACHAPSAGVTLARGKLPLES